MNAPAPRRNARLLVSADGGGTGCRGRIEAVFFHRPHLAFVSGVGISLNGERWVACGPLLMLSIDPA
jgi:hypothetical protein